MGTYVPLSDVGAEVEDAGREVEKDVEVDKEGGKGRLEVGIDGGGLENETLLCVSVLSLTSVDRSKAFKLLFLFTVLLLL